MSERDDDPSGPAISAELSYLLIVARELEASVLREQAAAVAAMSPLQYLGRGIRCASTTDALAGRMAKAGWLEIVWNPGNPGWVLTGQSASCVYERRITSENVREVLDR